MGLKMEVIQNVFKISSSIFSCISGEDTSLIDSFYSFKKTKQQKLKTNKNQNKTTPKT